MILAQILGFIFYVYFLNFWVSFYLFIEIEKYKQMAFVYRSRRDTIKRPVTPSPSAYKVDDAKLKPNRNVTTTFVDRTTREIWKDNEMPGPGQYATNIPSCYKSSQILHCDNQLIIIDGDSQNKIKGCSSSFKSKTKRLGEKRCVTPGPGQYEIKKQTEGKRKCSNIMKKPTQLTRYLFGQAQKQAFKGDYDTQYEDSKVFINQELSNFPKQQACQAKLAKQSTFFSSKVQREKPVRPMTSVGPGSYDISKSYEALHKKHSKITRQQPSSAIKTQQFPDFLKQSIEVLPSEVGPGKYNIQSNLQEKKKSWSKGISCFGSLQRRFSCKQSKKREKQESQDKFIVNELKKKSCHQKQNEYKKTVPFMSGLSKQSASLFNKPIMVACPVVSYETTNNMYDNLLKKSKLSSTEKGKIVFGSGKDRFKSMKDIQRISNGHSSHIQEPLQICSGSLNTKKKQKCQMKKKTIEVSQWKKGSEKKTFIDNISHEENRPICYDNNTKTIQKSFEGKVQQVPFMAMSQRFKTFKQSPETKIINQLTSHQNNLVVGIKESKQNGMKSKNMIKSFLKEAKKQYLHIRPIKNKDERVLGPYKENYENIGPNSYSPTIPKKNASYNTLFKVDQIQ